MRGSNRHSRGGRKKLGQEVARVLRGSGRRHRRAARGVPDVDENDIAYDYRQLVVQLLHQSHGVKNLRWGVLA